MVEARCGSSERLLGGTGQGSESKATVTVKVTVGSTTEMVGIGRRRRKTAAVAESGDGDYRDQSRRRGYQSTLRRTKHSSGQTAVVIGTPVGRKTSGRHRRRSRRQRWSGSVALSSSGHDGHVSTFGDRNRVVCGEMGRRSNGDRRGKTTPPTAIPVKAMVRDGCGRFPAVRAIGRK